MDAFISTFQTIFDSASDFVNFISKIPNFIILYLNVLPNEIKTILIPVLMIVIAIFVYRFVK